MKSKGIQPYIGIYPFSPKLCAFIHCLFTLIFVSSLFGQKSPCPWEGNDLGLTAVNQLSRKTHACRRGSKPTASQGNKTSDEESANVSSKGLNSAVP